MKKRKNIIPQKWIPFIRNKYTLTLLGFLVWLSFFDRNDFITTYSFRKKLENLRNEKEYYEEGIKKNTEDLHNLLSSYQNLEKYGRENYLMKRDNEDIFVIVNEPEKK